MSAPANRAKTGQFKKGASGNPNGRPKLAEEFREGCKRVLDEKVLRRWEQELDQDGPDWMKASELIAAYAIGKPTQKVEVKELDSLTDEQLEARYRALVSSATTTATEPPK